MGVDGVGPRLEALHALLASARELARMLQSDPTLPRVLQALAGLAPEERAILAAALERGAAARRINEGFSRLNGVRLRINPNPRLFVRVVDTDEPANVPPLEEEDILPDVLRLMRRVPLLMAPESQAVWRPAIEQALDMLSPRGRQACLRFVEEVLALVAPTVAADSPDEPS